MPYDRLILVLPCSGLDDFPEQLEDTLAEDLLGAWTSLWAPELLVATSGIPEWKRADSASLDVENSLVLATKSSAYKVDQPTRERLALHGSLWIESQGPRHATLNKIHEVLAESSPNEAPGDCSPERKHDFFALGFAFLQVQLLTRRLRYSSNLNQPLFTEQALESAKAFLAGNDEEYERWIQSCFDQLSQERDHYYSQSAYLLDVTLLAPTTLGAKLTQQLQVERPINLLASASILKKLAETNPDNASQLKDQVLNGKVDLIGGMDVESEWSAWTPRELAEAFREGEEAYRQLGYAPPKIFGRYAKGMTADMPMHLALHGYQAAILFDWEGGSYPSGNQAKITWEAADGTGLDALADYILDGSSPNAFLAIGSRLGAQLDHHQVPTLVLAHWPGGTCEAFEDFLAMTRRTPAMGVWTGMQTYFATTQRPYHQERIAPSKFPVPDRVLQDSEKELLGRSIQWENGNAIESLAVQLGHWLGSKAEGIEVFKGPSLEMNLGEQAPFFEGLLSAQNTESRRPTQSNPDRLTKVDVEGYRTNAMQKLRSVLPRKGSATGKRSWLFCNPSGGPRRVFATLPGVVQADPELRIYAADPSGNQSDVAVDIPPMGIVRVEEANAPPARKKGPTIASSPTVLSNEFIEGHIDPKSGKLMSLYIAQRRGNRMSGMLALRHGEGTDAYSTMQADKIDVLHANTVRGSIRVQGRLMVGKETSAHYTIAYTLWKGSRLIEAEFEVRDIDPRYVRDDSYVAWRTAWPNESAVLKTWNQGAKQNFTKKQAFTTHLVEIDEVEHRGYILTGGSSVHRKTGERILDTVIATTHQPPFRGRLAFGIDLPRPYQASVEWMDPPMWIEDDLGPLASGIASWFIQSNVAQVSLTPVQAITNEEGKLKGMRAWLHESAGKGSTARIECFRSPRKADRVTFSGKTLGKIDVEGDTLILNVKPNEQSLIDILWS